MTFPRLEFADLARSGHVTRWHSVRTTRNQTLAEHHYMVTRLSNRLAKEILGDALDDSGLLRIMDYASLHDTPELLMGDLPSPLKRHIEAISGDNNPIQKIEQEIAPWLGEMREEMRRRNPEHLLIVKLADLIDALLFIEHEGLGVHAREVARGLREILATKLAEAIGDYPQFNWSAAERLLDELLNNRVGTKIAFEKVRQGDL
ncbi:MAG: HD domain-containing protein [Desulfobulbaceae bacterium]|uniref:HD domain-containing protein n=1 Tax=Candidatus Desulfatifera sulfidica TaxID=2841691 RepID=A0A8J6N7I5_9BACT|nr:HD domain-containing protein [Candidatus Desulfatifera sulfidica]